MISSVAYRLLAGFDRPYIKSRSRRSAQIYTKTLEFSEQLCYSSLDAGV
ncbi:hypothetical protein [Microcoleus sp. S13C4]